jgi:hypothetical protein
MYLDLASVAALSESCWAQHKDLPRLFSCVMEVARPGRRSGLLPDRHDRFPLRASIRLGLHTSATARSRTSRECLEDRTISHRPLRTPGVVHHRRHTSTPPPPIYPDDWQGGAVAGREPCTRPAGGADDGDCSAWLEACRSVLPSDAATGPDTGSYRPARRARPRPSRTRSAAAPSAPRR